jgi:hypothetical protein
VEGEAAAAGQVLAPGRDMTWDEFESALVEAGWDPEEAKRERREQEHGQLGDCDGDLGP